MIGFEPVQLFVEELRARFGHLALFFHDGVNTTEVRVVWRPRCFLPTAFKVTQASFSIPMGLDTNPEQRRQNAKTSHTKGVPNIAEMLSEMRSVGDGIVSAVDVK